MAVNHRVDSDPLGGRVVGVAIRYSNRTRVAYPVGSRELLDPRPPWPQPVAPVSDDPALT
jgi:hypothetical protein